MKAPFYFCGKGLSYYFETKKKKKKTMQIFSFYR